MRVCALARIEMGGKLQKVILTRKTRATEALTIPLCAPTAARRSRLQTKSPLTGSTFGCTESARLNTSDERTMASIFPPSCCGRRHEVAPSQRGPGHGGEDH